MHTLKRSALAVTIVTVMLVTGACGSDGGDSKDATTTTAAAGGPTTTRAGNGGTKPKDKAPSKNAKIVAYCAAVAQQKPKMKMKTSADAKAALPLVKASNAIAPQSVKQASGVQLKNVTALAATTDQAAFNAAKKAQAADPATKQAYKQLAFFNGVNC